MQADGIGSRLFCVLLLGVVLQPAAAWANSIKEEIHYLISAVGCAGSALDSDGVGVVEFLRLLRAGPDPGGERRFERMKTV